MDNIKQTTPRWLWYGVEDVVREGFNGVEQGKVIVVSGRLYRWLDPLMQSVWTRWMFKAQGMPETLKNNNRE